MIDSRPETYKHILTVQKFLGRVVASLLQRSLVHDQSKLVSPELEVFDEYTPQLAGITYGSDEYRAILAKMRPAVNHHQQNNSHHPEFYRWSCPGCSRSFSDLQAPCFDAARSGHGDNRGSGRFCPECTRGAVIYEAELVEKPDRGIRGMSLLDLVEMFCDWKAASLRHENGDIRKSIEMNQSRFGYSDDLKQIMLNTLPLIEDPL